MTADWWISHIHPEDLDVVLSSITALFATGYDKAQLKDIEDGEILTKPFFIEELGRLIRQQLDS